MWRGLEEQARQQELWRGTWAGLCAWLAMCQVQAGHVVLSCLCNKECMKTMRPELCNMLFGCHKEKRQELVSRGHSRQGSMHDVTVCVFQATTRPSYTTYKVASIPHIISKHFRHARRYIARHTTPKTTSPTTAAKAGSAAVLRAAADDNAKGRSTGLQQDERGCSKVPAVWRPRQQRLLWPCCCSDCPGLPSGETEAAVM